MSKGGGKQKREDSPSFMGSPVKQELSQTRADGGAAGDQQDWANTRLNKNQLIRLETNMESTADRLMDAEDEEEERKAIEREERRRLEMEDPTKDTFIDEKG